MDELAAEIVDRVRSVRSLSWLRAIDAADFDAPVTEEPDADVVVAPYRWLLDRVGDGVKLTQAGYLPPTVVEAAMTKLGWAEDWYGKNNRGRSKWLPRWLPDDHVPRAVGTGAGSARTSQMITFISRRLSYSRRCHKARGTCLIKTHRDAASR